MWEVVMEVVIENVEVLEDEFWVAVGLEAEIGIGFVAVVQVGVWNPSLQWFRRCVVGHWGVQGLRGVWTAICRASRLLLSVRHPVTCDQETLY